MPYKGKSYLLHALAFTGQFIISYPMETHSERSLVTFVLNQTSSSITTGWSYRLTPSTNLSSTMERYPSYTSI